MNRKSLGCSLALATAIVPSVLAAAEAPRIESREDALSRDATEYARRYGVSQAQAMRELAAQSDSVPLTDAIAREFAARLVGITIEHRPGFAIAVLLTGDEPVAPRMLVLAGLAVPVTFRIGAAASHSALIGAITRHQAAIRAGLARAPGIGLDTRTGEMVVQVSGPDWARDPIELAGRLTRQTGVPVRVDRAGGATDMMIGGGARVVGSAVIGGRRSLCTTGFAVTDGLRTGVATAAHCPDELSHVDADRSQTMLPFVSQAGWGYQDVQINASPTPLQPLIFADTPKMLVRPVEAMQGRASTRAGDFVCRRGERTGYSCAEVLMTDFAPAGDLCGGACLPTWVAVEGPTCRGGDSGAPVFVGTTALGLVKGGTYRGDGSCAIYYYMSVDYLPSGWSLLLSPRDAESGNAEGQGNLPAPLPSMPSDESVDQISH